MANEFNQVFVNVSVCGNTPDFNTALEAMWKRLSSSMILVPADGSKVYIEISNFKAQNVFTQPYH